MTGTIELVAGTGLDENDIAEIQNAIEAALQGTRHEELFFVTTTREIDSDTSIYYLRVRVPFDGITDDYADMCYPSMYAAPIPRPDRGRP